MLILCPNTSFAWEATTENFTFAVRATEIRITPIITKMDYLKCTPKLFLVPTPSEEIKLDT